MKSLFGVFSLVLCASFIIFASPSPASAQTSGAKACAALAGKNIPGIPRQVTPGARFSILQQVMQDKRYLKCLQAHGQQTAPRASATATAGTFVTFDFPGSTCLPRYIRCTAPTAINPAGAVTGIYADAIGAMHAFLRAPDGTFTNIDVPGTVCPFFFSFCTQPTGINSAGAITGTYCCGATTFGSGFLRTQSGTFTNIDYPGSIYTQPNGINMAGTMVVSHVWMAPRLTRDFFACGWVACGHVSGLYEYGRTWTAGPDGFRGSRPYQFVGITVP